MSIPPSHIRDLLTDLEQSRVENLIAQADARRILQEVKEVQDNYPNFDPDLTEKMYAHRLCFPFLRLLNG